MRVKIPDFADKQSLFAYLRTNKSKIIAQKKSLPIVSDNLEFGYSKVISSNGFSIKKVKDTGETLSDSELDIDVIANLSGWCDSYMDVMIENSWNRSIKDKGALGTKLFYHLKNHDYSTDDLVGKDASLYTKDIDLSQFNIKSDIKTAQGLMMHSTVVFEYDNKVFILYRDGQIKQHSIGLQYVQLHLCLNSEVEDDAEEKKNWDKYYDQVINKDKIDAKGYFWAVVEAKILEVSTVLWGANELTSVESMKRPPSGTADHPLKDTDLKDANNKSVVICPNCTTTFNATTSSSNCPNCGQYVSIASTAVQVDAFNLLEAIQQTKFVNY